ncbi:MAG: hypothetical protein V7736_05905 [Colwellia polaris]
MNFYDYKKFETILVKNNIDLELWPFYKFILFNSARKKVIKKESKNINYFYFLIILSWSFLLFGFYVFRSHIFSPLNGIVFGASTRLNNEGDWLLGNKALDNKIALYHVNDFNFAMLKKTIINKVVAINLLVEVFVRIFSIKGKTNCKSLSCGESQLINLISDLLMQQEGGDYDHIKKTLLLETVKFKLAKGAYSKLISLIKTDTNKAIIISAYSKTSVVAALHQLSFYVSEYQHGLIAPFHPISGTNPLIESTLLVDDYYLTSRFWLKAFRPYDNRPLHIFTPEHYQDSIITASINKPYVIFTSQDENYDVVIKFIENFFSVFSELVLLYRPHPRGDLQDIKRMFSSQSNFVYADTSFDKSTRSLILNSVAHVSMYSACHFDAFELKGKSYFLKPINGLLFPNRVFENDLKGIAFIINDAYDLKANIGHLINE